MQKHEQRDPDPRPPDPKDTQAKWLLFAIAVLLGLVSTEMVKRLM
jgi:hypothetical protein